MERKEEWKAMTKKDEIRLNFEVYYKKREEETSPYKICNVQFWKNGNEKWRWWNKEESE